MATPKLTKPLNGNPAQEPWDKREAEVWSLLQEALNLAAGDYLMVTDWLDSRDELEGYGYTTELEEQIGGLDRQVESLQAEIPSPNGSNHHQDVSEVLESCNMLEKIQVEEFFATLLNARKGIPA